MEAIRRPKYRAIFLSDLHLGSRACRADDILAFLREFEAETIFLVGDVVDFWKLKNASYWPQEHNDVVQKLLRKVRKGSRLVFIPGNHDDALRAYCGDQFGGIEVVRDAIHTTADGRRLLVIHGDEFDALVSYGRWKSFLGDRSYVLMLWANTFFAKFRSIMGLKRWSLSNYLKNHLKLASKFIGDFEASLSAEAIRRGLDGVVCGHIHHAAVKDIDGVRYYNCGDWVESCTALAEDMNGQFHLIYWHEAVSNRDAVYQGDEEADRPTAA